MTNDTQMSWSEVRDEWVRRMDELGAPPDPVIEIAVVAQDPLTLVPKLSQTRATWWPHRRIERDRVIDADNTDMRTLRMGDNFFDKLHSLPGAARSAAKMLARHRGDIDVTAATLIAMSGLAQQEEYGYHLTSHRPLGIIRDMALDVLLRHDWEPTWRSNQSRALPRHLDWGEQPDTFEGVIEAMAQEHAANLREYAPIVLEPHQGTIEDHRKVDFDELVIEDHKRMMSVMVEVMRTMAYDHDPDDAE